MGEEDYSDNRHDMEGRGMEGEEYDQEDAGEGDESMMESQSQS